MSASMTVSTTQVITLSNISIATLLPNDNYPSTSSTLGSLFEQVTVGGPISFLPVPACTGVPTIDCWQGTGVLYRSQNNVPGTLTTLGGPPSQLQCGAFPVVVGTSNMQATWPLSDQPSDWLNSVGNVGSFSIADTGWDVSIACQGVDAPGVGFPFGGETCTWGEGMVALPPAVPVQTPGSYTLVSNGLPGTELCSGYI
jgi:hypothetical protein